MFYILISTVVTTTWNSRTKKHYENLGHKFTKLYDEFLVNVNDLCDGSSVMVEVKCDGNNCDENNCETILNISWCNYLKKEKHYCKKCSAILKGSVKKRLLKINNGDSFAQWGINNLGEDFLDKYWDWDKNNELGIDPWKITKGCNKPKVWIKCQEKDYHGSYEISCHMFIENRRCSYCGTYKLHYLDSLGHLYPQVLNIWSDKNKDTVYDYGINSNQWVWWKCPEGKHDDYYRNIQSSNNCGYRCPECVRERDESLLQEKVRLYLESLNYKILHENKCTLNPINIIIAPNSLIIKRNFGILKYDNEIIINNKHLIIEVHGIQHYELSYFHKLQSKKYNTTPEQEFKYQQEKDKYKEEYALSKGYEYLIIPYFTDNNEETWKYLINNKIDLINKMNVDHSVQITNINANASIESSKNATILKEKEML